MLILDLLRFRIAIVAGCSFLLSKQELDSLTATFREEDAAAGESVSGEVHLRQLVGEASGGLENHKAALTPVRDH